MHEDEAERIARTESIFREVNERIAETAGRLDAGETGIVCECADPSCAERLTVSLAEYERVRTDGAAFLLAHGHEDDRVEAVTERRHGHAVVQKRHPRVRAHALRLDPRRASRPAAR